MRHLILSLVLFSAACDSAGPAASRDEPVPDASAPDVSRGTLPDSGPDGGAGVGGQAGAQVSTDAGAAGSAVAEPDAGAPGQIQVTWTFKDCGDNGISIGVTDMTTGKGLAGPISVKKPQGNIFTLAPVTFSCASGDIVCWSSSDGSGMCGACASGEPSIGC